jgi:hypothetical protein
MNDELMDALLKDALTADVPRLSPAFDARVMRRARPRRLTTAGRVAMAAYVIAAAAAAAWAMHDLPLTWIAASLAAGVPVAIGAGAYGRRLAFGQ